MSFLQNLRVSARLALLSALFLVAMLVMVSWSIFSLHSISSQERLMYQERIAPMQKLNTAALAMAIHFRRGYSYIYPIAGDPKSRIATRALNQKAEAQIQDAFDYLQGAEKSPQLEPLLAALKQASGPRLRAAPGQQWSPVAAGHAARLGLEHRRQRAPPGCHASRRALHR